MCFYVVQCLFLSPVYSYNIPFLIARLLTYNWLLKFCTIFFTPLLNTIPLYYIIFLINYNFIKNAFYTI